MDLLKDFFWRVGTNRRLGAEGTPIPAGEFLLVACITDVKAETRSYFARRRNPLKLAGHATERVIFPSGKSTSRQKTGRSRIAESSFMGFSGGFQAPTNDGAARKGWNSPW